MNIIQCENSYEGIFSAVYDSYVLKLSYRDTIVEIMENANRNLFASYYEAVADPLKMEKVIRTVVREFGESVYYEICMALANCDGEKANAVYQTIAHGLTLKNRHCVLECLNEDGILTLTKLSLTCKREYQHLQGFLRFQELSNGVLASRIAPRHDVTCFLAQHFMDRFPKENFMIYDERRDYVAVHPAGKMWFTVSGEEFSMPKEIHYSEKEEEFQRLFQYFCKKISIRERENEKLQRNMLPLRFRPYMTEYS